MSTVQHGIIQILFRSRVNGNSPVIFLDRDGIINRRVVGGYVTNWEAFRFIPGVRKMLREISTFGLPIVIASNQACIGKGLLTAHALEGITHRFVDQLVQAGIRIDAIYYCPHRAEDHCRCRKPEPGLLLRAASDFGANLSKSVFVGDSPTDLEAARSAGCRGVLFSPVSSGQPSEPGEIVVHKMAQLAGAVRGCLPHLDGQDLSE